MKSKITPLKQTHSSGCGPTSIKIIADSFSVKISKKEIEHACGDWKSEGMSNEELVTSLNSLGFKTEASYNNTWDDIQKALTNNSQIIVSWMLKGYIGHFSVVEKITDKKIWLADPESGTIISFEKIAFLRLWLDHGEKWYPETKQDFQLRWMVLVTK